MVHAALVDGALVDAALVDAALVDGLRAGPAILLWTLVATRLGCRLAELSIRSPARLPGIGARGRQPDAQQAGQPDTGSKRGHTDHALHLHMCQLHFV